METNHGFPLQATLIKITLCSKERENIGWSAVLSKTFNEGQRISGREAQVGAETAVWESYGSAGDTGLAPK